MIAKYVRITEATGLVLQALYEMSPAYEGHRYVVLSTVFGIHPYTRIETYIFPSNAQGQVTDWGELTGSQVGVTDHSRIIYDIGYRIEP